MSNPMTLSVKIQFRNVNTFIYNSIQKTLPFCIQSDKKGLYILFFL